MALDIFNLATQSFVGGAVNAGQRAINDLTTSAINALGGNLTGGYASGGLIRGTGMVPDFPCGMGSAGCSGFGGGVSGLNDPCGQFNDPFNNAFESMALRGVSGTIGAIGQLALTGNLDRFENNLVGVATNVGSSIMGNLGSSVVKSLVSSVGNSSLSDAKSWLSSASDSISSWF